MVDETRKLCAASLNHNFCCSAPKPIIWTDPTN